MAPPCRLIQNNIGYPVVSRRILEVGSLVSYSRNRRLSDQTVNPLSIKQRDVRRMDSCGYSRIIQGQPQHTLIGFSFSHPRDPGYVSFKEKGNKIREMRNINDETFVSDYQM